MATALRSRSIRCTAACLTLVAVLGGPIASAHPATARPTPPARAALGGGSTFTLPSKGDGTLSVTFTVTGATVTPVAGAPEGTYEGMVTGDKVSIQASGTFTMGEGLVTYLGMSVSVAADSVNRTSSWPSKGGKETVHGPLAWAQSLSAEVAVTKGVTRAVFFSVELGNCGDWVCGGVSGNGTLTGWVPLCAEASQFFLDQAAAYDHHGIRVGYDQLSAQVQTAIDQWEAEHSAKATMSKGGDAVAAGMWLFSDKAVDWAPWVSSFSLSPDPDTKAGAKALADVTVNQVSGKLYDGRFTPPPGSESALAQTIARASTKQQRRLGMGDVYKLALDQTGGDTMLAALLAHNTLRSLAREGTIGFTGLVTDPSFFGKYLVSLRDGDNAGVWYHTFGTMYYQLENAQGTTAASKVYSTLGVAGAGVMYIPTWLFGSASDYVFGSTKAFRLQQMLEGIINGALPTNRTGWSGFANAAEQAYRQIYGGNPPDPEKYCFNVWGTNLAQAIIDRVITTPPFQVFDSTRTNPFSNLAGDTMDINRIGGTGSPVDVKLEVDGVTLFLDQQAGVMAANGDFPYPVWPYRTAEGTFGLWWVVPAGQPEPTVTYTAVKSGSLHHFDIDATTGQVTTWVTDVVVGDSATWTAGTMTDAKGVAVAPRVITANFSADGHLMVADSGPRRGVLALGGLLLVAAGVVVVLWWRRRERAGRAS